MLATMIRLHSRVTLTSLTRDRRVPSKRMFNQRKEREDVGVRVCLSVRSGAALAAGTGRDDSTCCQNAGTRCRAAGQDRVTLSCCLLQFIR